MKLSLPNTVFDEKKRILFTKNKVPGKKVYGERLRIIEGSEFREWKPINSKLASAIIKGLRLKLTENAVVLYL